MTEEGKNIKWEEKFLLYSTAAEIETLQVKTTLWSEYQLIIVKILRNITPENDKRESRMPMWKQTTLTLVSTWSGGLTEITNECLLF